MRSLAAISKSEKMVVDVPANRQQQILGVSFDLIDHSKVFDTVYQWCQTRQRRYITVVNPHSVMLCCRDEQMSRAVARSDMTLPDGTGIIWAANILGYKNCGRVTGPDLMLKLCDWGRQAGYRHYFYGGKNGVAELLAEKLSKMYPGLKIAGTYCPPFRPLSDEENDAIIKKINAAQPDIVWVALGAPKQEKWMARHIAVIETKVMIGVGAAFDFHSGNIKWAPVAVRKLGLEWAWRLACEPKRMWRRNLDSPLFLAKVLCRQLK